MKNWLKLAMKVAKQGRHAKYKLGAVAIRGGAVLLFAANQSKPWGPENGGRHAEARVCQNKNGRCLRGATIYVARLGGGLSKPCKKCFAALQKAGISKMVYFNDDGQIIMERI
jgi:tRNA(Arg) A34 adenosine deaminase TadA